MIAAFIVFYASRGFTQTSEFGLGAMIGETAGISIKANLEDQKAIQVFLGMSFFPGDSMVIYADQLWNIHNFLKKKPDYNLWFYMGAGAKFSWFTGKYFIYNHDDKKKDGGFGDAHHFGFGARFITGLAFEFKKNPFDLFIEIAPLGATVVSPREKLYYDVDFEIGFRHYF
jgi:hypothetical protein